MVDDMQPQGGPPEGREQGPGHELTDVKVGGIATFGVSMVIMGVVIHYILGAFMGQFQKAERKDEADKPPLYQNQAGQFPEPQLLVEPRENLAKFRDKAETPLEKYGWVDRKTGVAEIPIDRAIDILAERGLPKGRNTPPRGSRTRDQK